MNRQVRMSLPLVGISLAIGCFSPNVGDDETENGAEAGTVGTQGGEASTESSGTSGAAQTSSASATSATGFSEDSADTATITSATDAIGSTTSGRDGFCGDGVVDESEECDDSLKNNGLDQSCLPDCNLNVCGDSNVGPSEACDDGEDDNRLEPGACAPDCSRMIETKEIVISNFALYPDDGDFGPNPVATADAMCPGGHRALVAVPSERQVTSTPNQADAVVDWPLDPFTAYSNIDGEIVWITDEMPLLGSRDGLPESLLAAISEPDFVGGPYVITGLRQDWTANITENCNTFSSTLSGIDLALGTASDVDFFLDGGQFLDGCHDTLAPVLCVED